MAVIYCRSTDGNDADDGSTWALAKATLAAALTAAGASGTVYVSHQHAESQASSMTLTGSAVGTPIQIIGVNDSAEPPTTLSTTATVTTTGSNPLTVNSSVYVSNITLNVATGATSQPLSLLTSNTNGNQIWENCVFNLNGTSTQSLLIGYDGVGVSNCVIWVNSDLKCSSTSAQVKTGTARFVWNGGELLTGVYPTTLFSFQSSNTRPGTIELYGVDLSLLGSGKSIVDVSTMTGDAAFIAHNLRIDSAVSFTTGSFGALGPYVEFVNCAEDGGAIQYYFANYCGTINNELTIVRTGGASDGVTPFSRKLTSSANSKFHTPLELDLTRWFPSSPDLESSLGVGTPVTVTVEIVNDGLTLTDAEIWLEVEYMSVADSVLSTITSDRKSNILTTAANQTSSSVTWTTTGLTSPVKQKLSVTITPEMRGLIKAKVMLARPSTTVYVCPKMELTA